MRTFGETLNNDFYLLPNGNIAIITEGEAFAQCCKTRMQAIVGEMKYEADEGMPYFATAWNAYNPAQFEAAARTVILGVAGALGVTSFTVERDGEVLRYTATIQSIYGEISING